MVGDTRRVESFYVCTVYPYVLKFAETAMSEGCHQHHVAAPALDIVTQVAELGTGSDEVIQEDVVHAPTDLPLKPHPFADTAEVTCVGMGDIRHGDDVVVNGHADGRELGGIGRRYHVDVPTLHLVVVNDVGMGIAPGDVRYLAILDEGIDQPQGSVIVTMLGRVEVRMLACHPSTGVVDDGRKRIPPSASFRHCVLLAEDVHGCAPVYQYRRPAQVHQDFLILSKREQHLGFKTGFKESNGEIGAARHSWQRRPPTLGSPLLSVAPGL